MTNNSRKIPVDTVVKVGQQGTRYQQKQASGYTQEHQEEDYEIVIDRSAAEIIDQINKRVTSPYYSIFIGVPTLLCFFLSFTSPIFLIFLIPGIIASYLVFRQDIIRKTTPLIYEFDDEYSKQKFNYFSETLQSLSSSKRVWRLKSQIAIEDWKRNAGSQSIIVRQTSRVGQIIPNLIKTNINVWGIDSGSITLYFFPDLIFVFQNGVYSTIAYNELKVVNDDLQYTEHEALPQDATVIGQTWKFVRRDGGPDRRFNNNQQLPIVSYGLVQLTTQRFVLYLIVSSLKVASSFTNSLSQLLGLSQSNSLQSKTIQPKSNIPQLETSLSEQFEILEKAAIQKTSLTTSQVADLLGLSKSVVTKNQDSFEYEAFRFNRAGRIGREIAWQVTKLKR